MGKYRSSRNGFSWSRLFLVLLIVVCCAAVVWTGNLLFANQIGQVMGIIIILAAIGVLIWNVSLLRRHQVGGGIFFAVFIITALLSATVCAFSGIEPLASVKQKLTASVESFVSQTQAEFLPATEYPAQISGHVVIADKVIAYYDPAQTETRMELTPPEGKIWWVIDISVRNIAYEEEIIVSYDRWAIEADGQIYYAKSYLDMIRAAYPMNVPTGQTGQTTFRFLVPDSLKVGETKLIYQCSEGVSYGTLRGGEMVPLYDWDSRTVIREPIEDYMVSNKHMQLRTIASWHGSESRAIRFRIDKSPWVVNWKWEPVSEIARKFNIIVVPESEYDPSLEYDYFKQGALAFLEMAWAPGFNGEESIVVPKSGGFVILVDASGVNWWIRVGVE